MVLEMAQARIHTESPEDGSSHHASESPSASVDVTNGHKQGKESPSSVPTCSNCSTQTTPLWRRSETGLMLCNACSLYQKMKGCPRPVSLKSNVIKHRNRSKGSKKDKAARNVPATEFPQDPTVHTSTPNGLDEATVSITSSYRSSSTSRSRAGGRKSQPGGSQDDDDYVDGYESLEGRSIPHARRSSSAKRFKRFSPDHNGDNIQNGAGPSSLSAFQNFQASQDPPRARSMSSDRISRPSSRNSFISPSLRSPSQPANLGHTSFKHHYSQSNPVSASHTPWNSSRLSHDSSDHIRLPSIRSMISETTIEDLDDETTRGRPREKVTLPSLRHTPASVPDTHPLALNVLPMERPEPFPIIGSSFDKHFPQSQSRRPPSSTSSASSGMSQTKDGVSPHSPLSSTSHIKSPHLQPLPEDLPSETRYSPRPARDMLPSRKPSSNFDYPSRVNTPDRSMEDRLSAIKMDGDPSSLYHHQMPWRRPQSGLTSRQSPPVESQELTNLRMRVAELELINSLLVSRVNELEGKGPAPNGPEISAGTAMDES